MTPDQPNDLIQLGARRSTWHKLGALLWSNKGKALAWLGTNAVALINDFWWKLLPIPGDLRLRGFIFTLLLTLISAVISTLTIVSLSRWLTGQSLRWTYAGFAVLSLILFSVFYNLFFAVEQWWKSPETPEEYIESIYHFWEPLVYGMAFASLAALSIFLVVLGKDLLDLYDAGEPPSPQLQGPPAPASPGPPNAGGQSRQ
jgi:hypothetical protein